MSFKEVNLKEKSPTELARMLEDEANDVEAVQEEIDRRTQEAADAQKVLEDTKQAEIDAQIKSSQEKKASKEAATPLKQCKGSFSMYPNTPANFPKGGDYSKDYLDSKDPKKRSASARPVATVRPSPDRIIRGQ